MPGSATDGKDLIKNFVIENNIKTVLDVGPGEGTYYELLKDTSVKQLDGVEAWAPYINQFNLRDKYHHTMISDIYYFNWEKAGHYDLIIIGDVFEHLTEDQGKEVLFEAAIHADWVALSLPIHGWEQGWGEGGNWFEAHLVQYSHEDIMNLLQWYKYEILVSYAGPTLGVYIFK